jgi:hypothetical protein
MTPATSANRLPGSRAGAALVILGLAFVVCELTVLYLPAARSGAIPTVYATPLVLIMGLLLSVRILSYGTQTLPIGAFVAGCGFVVGGAAFDVIATIIHTSDLAQETNPIARVLLETGHSVTLVYVYAGFCQVAFALLICVLWAGLLRHRTTIVSSVRESTTVMQLVKALTGGAGLTWRQWLWPLKISELPDFSYYVWALTVILVAGAAYRWYLGLEWFGFSPIHRVYVGIAAGLIGFTAYVAWAHREIQHARRGSKVERAVQEL